jgi:hypothetical protein
MIRTSFALLASMLLPAIACSSTTQGRDADARVTLTTDRSSYAPTDVVHVTLKNDSDGNVDYNLCAGDLELLTSQSWHQVERFPEPPGVCVSNLLILSPGASIQVDAMIPANAANGHYRLSYSGSPPAARTTNEFVVAAVLIEP